MPDLYHSDREALTMAADYLDNYRRRYCTGPLADQVHEISTHMRHLATVHVIIPDDNISLTIPESAP